MKTTTEMITTCTRAVDQVQPLRPRLPEPAAPFKLAVTVLGWTLRENGAMLTEGLPADMVALKLETDKEKKA